MTVKLFSTRPGKGAYKRAGNPRFCRCGSPLERIEKVVEYEKTGEPLKIEVIVRCSGMGKYEFRHDVFEIVSIHEHDHYQWIRKATKQERRNTALWEPLPIMGRKARPK